MHGLPELPKYWELCGRAGGKGTADVTRSWWQMGLGICSQVKQDCAQLGTGAMFTITAFVRGGYFLTLPLQCSFRKCALG